MTTVTQARVRRQPPPDPEAVEPPVEAKKAPKTVLRKPLLEDGALEKFEIERIHRSQIKGAPYNPRTINDDAKRKLKDNLMRVGLLSPLVWNKRSGNLVSGHQRLSQMDTLMGTNDYHMKVAAVDLDEKTEKEQNIFFNNPDAMGDWDLNKLGDLFKSGIEIEATGFSLGDVKDLFGGDVLQQQDLMKLSDAVGKTHDMERASSTSIQTEHDARFYLVAVFKDDAAMMQAVSYFGLKYDRYIDGRRMFRAIVDKIKEGDMPPPELIG